MPGAEPQESGKPADQIPIRLGDSKILKSLLTCWDGKFYDPHLIENDFHFHLNGVIVGCAFKHVKGFLRISLSGER